MPYLVSPTYKQSPARWFQIHVAETVVQKADGTFETTINFSPSNPDYVGALNVWRGGYQNYVTPAQGLQLFLAGYTVTDLYAGVATKSLTPLVSSVGTVTTTPTGTSSITITPLVSASATSSISSASTWNSPSTWASLTTWG